MSGKCVVCDEAATQTCAHCGTISYCGKQHQKEHWQVHRTLCKPYRIETSELLGRYIVASRDIKAGELIVKESPLVVGPRMDSTPLCLACYKTAEGEPRLCSRCGVAPICCPECETRAPHDGECETFKRLSGSLAWNPQVVMPLRCLWLRQQPEVWSKFTGLESHLEKREGTSIWKHHKDKIIDFLTNAGAIVAGEDSLLLQKICGILDVNSFELRGPNPALMTHSARQGERLRGVYLEAALMSHDCVGNTHLSVDDDYVMTIHASVPIKAGESVVFNYASTLECTSERLTRLREGKYFSCTCRRCSDPTELGTYMSSIVCSRCHDGFVVAENPLQKVNEANIWLCEKCQHQYNPRLIRMTFSQAWSEIEEADNNDPQAMENLLKRFSRTFPKTSVVMVEIKQNLVALYREAILKEPSVTRKVLQRKMNLCLELLEFLDMVEPGISRLRGITMYELHLPKVMLANIEYDSGEISADELLTRLADCENLLKEAISILLYEPSNSPEGKLFRIAMDELRALRENIQDVKMLNESQDDGRKNKRRSSGKKSKK